MVSVINPRQLCEGCRNDRATETLADDNAEDPYRVCNACRRRLESRSLRPREWFDLAARYGWNQYLLHDDFYDDDGAAHQPEEDVDDPTAFP